MTAEPDGYTLLWSNSPVHFIAPFVSKTFTYDPLKDFTPIASVGTNSNVLVIVPSIPAKTLQEFIAYAKANPGKLNFGYGQGTTPHLVGALFKLETGIEFAFVPYKGGAQAVTDMLGGHIHMNFGTSSTLRSAHSRRQAAGSRRHRHGTDGRPSGSADHDRKRLSQSDVGDHLRNSRSCGPAGRCRQPDQQQRQREPEIARTDRTAWRRPVSSRKADRRRILQP